MLAFGPISGSLVGRRLGTGLAAREGEAQDRALHHSQLLVKRPGVVRQFVALAEAGTEPRTAKAQKLGLLVPIGDGLYEVPSPALLRAAGEVLERGVSLAAALAVIEKVKRNSETTSKVFVALFLDQIWKPFIDAGQPNDRWPDITEAIERLRPLASEVVLATFKQTMEAEVEKAFGKVLEEQAKRGP